MGLVPRLPAKARCEVVCFTSDPELIFKDLPVSRIRTVIEAWAHGQILEAQLRVRSKAHDLAAGLRRQARDQAHAVAVL